MSPAQRKAVGERMRAYWAARRADKAGTAQMSFIAIVPGTYTLSIPGSHSETQTATFVIQ